MGSNFSKPQETSGLDVVRKMTDKELRMWSFFIQREIKDRSLERPITVFETHEALRSSNKICVNTRANIFFSYDVVLDVPIPQTDNPRLVEKLVSINNTIPTLFCGENFYSDNCFPRFIEEECKNLLYLGRDVGIKNAEVFNLYGTLIIKFIQSLGIDPNSFCPWQITFPAFGCKLIFTGNLTYELVKTD
jgi:hypothetical protein